MIDFLKEQLKKRADGRLFKKYCQPRREFLAESRNLFIKKLSQEISAPAILKPRPAWAGILKYGLASFLAVFLSGSGLTVFAEKANVGASHPLYPLKRISETVQIKLAPSDNKVSLHNEFAERRLGEIKEIKTTNATSTAREIEKIESLDEDLHFQVNSALEEASLAGLKKEERSDLCRSISRVIEDEDEIIPENQPEESLKYRAKFDEGCKEFVGTEAEKKGEVKGEESMREKNQEKKEENKKEKSQADGEEKKGGNEEKTED
jgi:hypothetical protein